MSAIEKLREEFRKFEELIDSPIKKDHTEARKILTNMKNNLIKEAKNESVALDKPKK